jgi:radical SAM protein with 4Fe4S-binding SPASM domain
MSHGLQVIEIRARPHELTAVEGREHFEEFPADEGSVRDRHRWEAFRAAYAEAQSLREPSAFPLQVDFETISTCNMRCSFCTHGHEVIPRVLPPFADFARAIEEGEVHGLCSIKLNYINEPLLTPGLCDYVRFARGHGVLNVYFATNGTLLDAEVSRDLIEAGVSKIMVSLDAATAGTFREVRQSGRFDRIVANVESLIRMRDAMGRRFPLVRVNFLRNRLNDHEAGGFLERWTGIADMIGFQDEVGVPGVDSPVHAPDDVRTARDGFRCAFPFKLVVVDSAGKILPCCTFGGRRMPIGDIRTGTIAGAWQSPQMRSLRALHLAGGYASNDVCRHCIEGK